MITQLVMTISIKVTKSVKQGQRGNIDTMPVRDLGNKYMNRTDNNIC